jgi:retinoblastoma-like protein 1
MDLDEVQRQENRKTALMKPYSLFFKRVLSITAVQVFNLCHFMAIDEGVVEKIWSVLKALLAQETDLLIGRHLDQLIMCAIYGVCRVHPGCIKKSGSGQNG